MLSGKVFGMRPLALGLAFAVFISAAGGARAAEMHIPSKVDMVTVFPTGAEVTRVFDVKLDAGSHVLVIADLPAAVVENSIRVEGETSGSLEIGSVDARPIVVKVPSRPGLPDDNERRRIEDEIRRLTDERAALDGTIAAAGAQKALAENLARLPLAGVGKQEGSAPAPDWSALFELIGARMADAAKAVQGAQVKQRELDEQIKVLREKLQHEPPEEWQRTEVRVYVDAAGSAQGRLRVRYQVPSASWLPIYDARLTTGGGNRDASLTIARRAAISQSTGEDWTDADLTLSTTRPGGATSAPELFTLKVMFRPETRSMSRSEPVPGVMREFAFRREDGGAAPQPQEASAPIVEAGMAVEAQPYQTSFRIPQRVTVKSGVGQKKVFIAAETPKPSLLIRSAPKKDAVAYLHAKFTHEGIAPLLPGEVSLYRDGVFTGRGQLPLIVQGEEKELGFGPDDAVKIARVELKRAKGETGIIAASSTDEQHYKITVKNLHDWVMPVTIIDQVPVSEDEKIMVELLPMTTEPSERNYDDKLGLLAWSYDLKPQEEKAITLSYELKWPARREIIMTEY
jgi:uncharacterized protein (TIGR02231 family)